MTSVTDPAGVVIAHTYDANGNQLSTTTTRTRADGTTATVTTRQTFDSRNRAVEAFDETGGRTTCGWDPDSNLSRMTNRNDEAVGYRYDANNRLTLLTWSDGTFRVAEVLHRDSAGTPFERYTYAYDDTARTVTETDLAGSGSVYRYDLAGRPTAEETTPAGGTTTVSYTYDDFGNRLTRTAGGVTETYTYDANDRLLSVGNTTFEYDANGNLIRKVVGGAVATFEYGAYNRLLRVVQPDGTVTTYEYDHAGNRGAETVNGVTTRYFVDTAGPLPEVLEERNANGSVTTWYVYGQALISLRAGTDTAYYHTDGQASARR